MTPHDEPFTHSIVQMLSQQIECASQESGIPLRSLSQEKLADLAGLHRNYIGNIERGEQGIGIDNIMLLARTLKVKPAVLFDKF
jgi:DNA-binding XRE family transcriptional regulator